MRVVEIFKSIQGEGLSVGLPTTFVRCGGCNLRCQWCDTPYARDMKSGKNMKLKYILKRIADLGCENICITGGEPLLQKDEVYELINILSDRGFFIIIETNGSISIEDLPVAENICISMDYKLPSSGMEPEMDKGNLELLGPTDQLKFIVGDYMDYKVARTIINRYNPQCQIIIQPLWGIDLRNVAEWVLRDNLNVRFIPQIHKYIWGPEARER